MSDLDELGKLDALHPDRTGRGPEFSTEAAQLLDELLASADISAPPSPEVRSDSVVTGTETTSQYVGTETSLLEGNPTPAALEQAPEMEFVVSPPAYGAEATTHPESIDAPRVSDENDSGAPEAFHLDLTGTMAGAPGEEVEQSAELAAAEAELSPSPEFASGDEMTASETRSDPQEAAPAALAQAETGLFVLPPVYSAPVTDPESIDAARVGEENDSGARGAFRLELTDTVADAPGEEVEQSAELAAAEAELSPSPEFASGDEMTATETRSDPQEAAPQALEQAPETEVAVSRPSDDTAAPKDLDSLDAATVGEKNDSGVPEASHPDLIGTMAGAPGEEVEQSAEPAAVEAELSSSPEVASGDEMTATETLSDPQEPAPQALEQAPETEVAVSPPAYSAPAAFALAEPMTYAGSRPRTRVRPAIMAVLVVVLLVAALGAGFVALRQSKSTTQWRQRDYNEVVLNRGLSTRDRVLSKVLASDHSAVTSLHAQTSKLSGQVASLQAQLSAVTKAKEKTLGKNVLARLTNEAGTGSKAMAACVGDTSALMSEINSDLSKPGYKDPHLQPNTQTTNSACATARRDNLQLQSTLRGAQ
jgi:hypothetical protein